MRKTSPEIRLLLSTICISQTLPALKSFCVFSCLGILGLFALAITFFVACFTLDIMRTEQGRNACICCYKHKPEYKPNNCSQRNNFNIFLRKYYSKMILKLPVKVTECIITSEAQYTEFYLDFLLTWRYFHWFTMQF